MKKVIVTIVSCFVLVYTLAATNDYRNAGLGIPRCSNHGFEIPLNHTSNQIVREETTTIETNLQKPAVKTPKKTLRSTVTNATTPQTFSKKEIKSLQKNQKTKLLRQPQKTTDSSGVLIALIIVLGVLLTIALLVWGWYWLFWSVLYY